MSKQLNIPYSTTDGAGTGIWLKAKHIKELKEKGPKHNWHYVFFGEGKEK